MQHDQPADAASVRVHSAIHRRARAAGREAALLPRGGPRRWRRRRGVQDHRGRLAGQGGEQRQPGQPPGERRGAARVTAAASAAPPPRRAARRARCRRVPAPRAATVAAPRALIRANSTRRSEAANRPPAAPRSRRSPPGRRTAGTARSRPRPGWRGTPIGPAPGPGVVTFRWREALLSAGRTAGRFRDAARLRLPARAWAWSASTRPTPPGNPTELHVVPGEQGIAAASAGPAKTVPSQYAGVVRGGRDQHGAAAPGRRSRTPRPARSRRSTPVTVSVTGVPCTLTAIRDPGCSPNRAAIAWVTATSKSRPAVA